MQSMQMQMGVSRAVGPLSQCRSVPLRTTHSQVAPGKAIRMPGLCTICGDLTRVKQLLHAAAARWKQIVFKPQVDDGCRCPLLLRGGQHALLVLAAAAAQLPCCPAALLTRSRPAEDEGARGGGERMRGERMRGERASDTRG